jgi:UbiD family decarboxylase
VRCIMYKDLRDWLQQVEEIGELKKVSQQVNPEEELTGIAYMACKTLKEKAPALLFENIKGYDQQSRALINILGPSVNRLALAMGLPTDLKIKDYVEAARKRIDNRIKPLEIDQKDAPINENVMTGDEIDLTRFPAPKFWPLDGGNYLGTADAIITKSPEDSLLNVGTFRLMVQNKNQLGFYASPGKDARIHYEGWWKRNEPCEIAAVIGMDPAMFITSGWEFAKNVSEYEFAGGIKGEPIEVVKGIATDLLVPARAEIVIEGVLRPHNYMPEGGFGEFTGYYGRPQAETPVIDVKAIRFRNNPIVTCALMAEYPACEHALMVSIIKSALIMNDLEKIGIPGIKGVYCYPAAAASYGMIVVSMEQKYAGHVSQVLSIASQVAAGAYYTKWVVAVEEDVNPYDINQVLWAMSTRCNPVDDIDILRNTLSTWLDPTQNPANKRPYGSKALINACREHKYLHQFAKRTRMRKETYDKIAEKWNELGFDASPAELETYEDFVEQKKIF